jgi:hypothetical protein
VLASHRRARTTWSVTGVIPYDYSGPDGTIAVTGDTRNDEMAVKRHVGRHGIEELLGRIAETAAGDAGVQYALTSSAAQAARSEAQAEQDELIAVIAELTGRARRAGTIRPGIEATDIAMLICGVVSAMGPRPGFDWR